ncbi:MAG: hypothetical protein LBT99_04325 [Bifidobacteriaceae bacterium]|jgi:glutamate--cysteine ligase|nr:hypothetical protein [Bifidobacteriaceae bacterium]
MVSKANDKHLESFVEYFETGYRKATDKSVGFELEHLVLDKDLNPCKYFGDKGIEKVLYRLKPFYRNCQFDNNHLIGLDRSKVFISLEPGAQLEVSIGPCKNTIELEQHYNQFRAEIDPILQSIGYKLINLGYQPKALAKDITLIPKTRYRIFDKFFIGSRQNGRYMMRGTASTQVTLDYISEQDAIDKFRYLFALGPIWAWLFANTPVFEGKTNINPLLRSVIWQRADLRRAGIIANIFAKNYSFIDYAILLDTLPLLVIENGEANGLSAAEVYPNRKLVISELEYIISNVFFDVRMKNFLELRTVDSLKISQVTQLINSVTGVFYNLQKFAAVKELLGDLTADKVILAKKQIIQYGQKALPYDKSFEDFQQILL